MGRAGIAIGGQKLAITTDRFDARPLAASGEAWTQVATGRSTRGTVAPRLAQDRPPAQDAVAGTQALGGHAGFRGGDLGTQFVALPR
jgi:hypothetical protein